jgi:hypothetical protein
MLSLSRGTILKCRFPFEDSPNSPGPAFHYCLFSTAIRGDLGFGANRNAKALGITSISCVGDRTHLPMGDSIHLPICMQNISVRIPRLFKIKDLRRIQFLHRFWLRANRNGWLLTRCVQDGVRCLRLFFPDLRPSSLNSGRNFGRQLNAQGFHDRQSRL